MTPRTIFARTALLSALFFSFILFGAAGRIGYTEGWGYFLASLAATVMNIRSIQDDPGLMRERTNPGEGIKGWDKRILGLSLLCSLATLVVAGLDSGRWHPSEHTAWGFVAAGMVLMVAGQGLFLAARKENRFFSTVMRIQNERGHTVCDSGPYRLVRHPGYLGMMIATIGIPMVLASVWSVIPTCGSVILLIARTHLEDAALLSELTGYPEYAARIRYRLIPRIW